MAKGKGKASKKSCWQGYEARGTKTGKNGTRVNNCVKRGTTRGSTRGR
jgi:hypothetical protein